MRIPSVSRPTGVLLLFLSLILLSACAALTEPDYPRLEAGELLLSQHTYGPCFLYLPTQAADPPRILAVIHGTPASDQTAEETARYYAEHWEPFAEEQGWLLIVPAFNQEDFSSRQGELDDARTGYRGLFGREIGAGEWLLELVNEARREPGWKQAPLLLYGHSAGGQFAARFLVTHPENVERVVISAAVTYPAPDPAVAWPYGLGPYRGEVIWEDGTRILAVITPDPGTWEQALEVPTTVIVGLNDREPQLSRPGQTGTNRIEIGRGWTEAMAAFGAERDLESQIRFEILPGKGHSMLGLMPAVQAALLHQD